jgi:hypothetical protein
MIDLNNDREHPVEQFFDEIFDAGWKAYIKTLQEENRASNYRLLKVIAKVKGTEFLQGVKHLLQKVGTATRITFVNKAKGIHFSNPDWTACGDVLIDQRSTAEGMQMDIYIPVKPNKYLWLRKHQ